MGEGINTTALDLMIEHLKTLLPSTPQSQWSEYIHTNLGSVMAAVGYGHIASIDRGFYEDALRNYFLGWSLPTTTALDLYTKTGQLTSELETQLENQISIQAEKTQLSAQVLMLQSNTAQWVSKDAYTAQVVETSAETRAFNAEIAEFLATAPAGEAAKAAQAGAKKDNTGIILIGAGVAVAALATIYFAGRKK